MYRGNQTKVLPIILVIIIVALVVTAIVSAVQSLMGSKNNNQATAQVDQAQTALFNTAETGRVQYTVRGPIVANENFKSYQIIITPSTRTLTTYTGYLDQVKETRQYENNVKAYDQFVHALDKANFLKKRDLGDQADDTRGICANGKLYEYDLMEGNQNIQHTWTSTCRGSKGSFMANINQVGTLFLKQIPDQSTMIRNLGL